VVALGGYIVRLRGEVTCPDATKRKARAIFLIQRVVMREQEIDELGTVDESQVRALVGELASVRRVVAERDEQPRLAGWR
jgi:hypothetical protein